MRTEDPLFGMFVLFLEFRGLTGPYFLVLPNISPGNCHLTALESAKIEKGPFSRQ